MWMRVALLLKIFQADGLVRDVDPESLAELTPPAIRLRS